VTTTADKDKIKAAADIVAIIQAEGVDLKKRGKEWQGLSSCLPSGYSAPLLIC
jgi:hypothetical protein